MSRAICLPDISVIKWTYSDSQYSIWIILLQVIIKIVRAVWLQKTPKSAILRQEFQESTVVLKHNSLGLASPEYEGLCKLWLVLQTYISITIAPYAHCITHAGRDLQWLSTVFQSMRVWDLCVQSCVHCWWVCHADCAATLLAYLPWQLQHLINAYRVTGVKNFRPWHTFDMLAGNMWQCIICLRTCW